jgi:hypothetical protein
MKTSAFITLTFAAATPPTAGYLLDNSTHGWACLLFIFWCWAILFAGAWFYRCVASHTEREAIDRWERKLREDGHPTQTEPRQ